MASNINDSVGYMGSIGDTSRLCSFCSQWHYGYHVCQSAAFPGTTAWITAPTLTVADVERIVAKALEDHSKIYLAVIEKLADALAGKK